MDRQQFIAWNRRKQMRFREQNELLIQEQMAQAEANQQTIDNPVIEQLLLLDGDGTVTTSGVGTGGTASPPPPIFDEFSFYFVNHGGATGASLITTPDAPFDITAALTLSAWVRPLEGDPGGSSDERRIIDKFAGSNGYTLYQTGKNSGTWHFEIGTGGGVEELEVEPGITSLTWYHLAATYSTVDGHMVLYINGASAGSLPIGVGVPITENSSGVILGNGFTSAADEWAGWLDELSIYDAALSAAQISEIYNGGVPNDLSTLSSVGDGVGWWRMGEGATFSGGTWTMDNVFNVGVGTATSSGMVEADRVSIVP